MIRLHANALKLVVLANTLGCLLTVSQAAERQLNIYNWNDYIDKQLLVEFTEQTGIKVVYSVYDSNALLETKMLSGGSGFDIVVPTLDFLGRQIQAGVFQKLDKSQLPNLKNMDREIERITRNMDPNNDYSINYMWGTVGLGLNEAKIKALLPDANFDSWSLLLDPQNAEKIATCGIYMLDTPYNILPITLLYLGLNPQSHDPQDLEKAGQALALIRPYIKKLDASEYISALANGDICLAIGYSGDVLQARDRAREAANGVAVSYHVPQEGAQVWFDQMAIPADAKNVAEAHEFLNFMMQAQNIASASNYINYANGNAAATSLLDARIRDDKGIYPAPETLKKTWTNPVVPAKTQRLFNKLWMQFQTATPSK